MSSTASTPSSRPASEASAERTAPWDRSDHGEGQAARRRRGAAGRGRPDLELFLGADAPADAAGSVVRSAALHAGLPSERATRLRVVIEELVREARERECVDGEAEVVVRSSTVGDVLLVSITDRRLPVAPGVVRTLASRRLAALGFVDRLHVSSHGVEGNVAECELHLHDTEAETLDHTHVLAPDVATVDVDRAEALRIRPMVPADATGVSQCVYRCYGYSYVDPIMYRPRLLRTVLRSGLVHAVVAVTPDDEVVGHIALTFSRSTDLVPEGGKLVVDPRYRGHHLAERLAAGRLDVAVRLELAGVWSECVTNQPYSQKEVLGGGGAETGLLIGATPESVTMAGIDNAAVGRHSLLTMWTPVRGTPAATVFVPDRHVEMVETIAGRLGLVRQVVGSAAEAPAHFPTSRLTTSTTPSIGLGQIRVHRVGLDLYERISDELDGLAVYDLAAVHLDLPVDHPSSAMAIEQLETLGFFWGAWLPGFTPRGDALRMQRVAEQAVDVDHVMCARIEGDEMRDAVVAEWHRVRHGVAPG